MKISDIRELAELMKQMDLTCVEINEKDTLKIKLERALPNPTLQATPENVVAQGSSVVLEAAAISSESQMSETAVGTVITSPTVGVYYSAPSPESAPFVQVGDKVKKGDVLCIIEAMKLMNEIPSEVDGVVTEIYTGNGQVVEYGQPLVRIV